MNQWRQYDDNYNEDTIEEVKPLSSIDYDRMTQIEDLTDFEFSTVDKSTSLIKGIGNEATKSITKAGGFFDNVFNGLNGMSKLFKYLPFLLVGYFSLKLFISYKVKA